MRRRVVLIVLMVAVAAVISACGDASTVSVTATGAATFAHSRACLRFGTPRVARVVSISSEKS
jgi:hypothetical protein